jgi:hypothetical protein
MIIYYRDQESCPLGHEKNDNKKNEKNNDYNNN